MNFDLPYFVEFLRFHLHFRLLIHFRFRFVNILIFLWRYKLHFINGLARFEEMTLVIGGVVVVHWRIHITTLNQVCFTQIPTLACFILINSDLELAILERFSFILRNGSCWNWVQGHRGYLALNLLEEKAEFCNLHNHSGYCDYCLSYCLLDHFLLGSLAGPEWM